MIKQLYIALFLAVTTAVAQQPKNPLRTAVDRSQILMGEEILYSISLETDFKDLIVFPELKNIGALEVIESYPVDSVRKNDKWFLYKKYGITQFDSGDYWLPRIEVIKNSIKFKTDSLLVKVREVQVDTTKQKMFPIKDAVDIPTQDFPGWYWFLLWLLFIPLGIVVWLLSRKRTIKTYEDTLQPFEWTKYRLQKLDESHAIENRDWKAYYTELTYIIRKYIDTKVYGQALESTTEQLIAALKDAMADKGMSITATTQARLEDILRRADLVKFAGMGSDGISAKEDRNYTNDIIYNINQVLPQPTEEELMMDAKYRRKLERKKIMRKVLIGLGIALLTVVAAAITWIVVKGWDNVKDAVLGNELRETYEQQWITTDYGVPVLTLSAPDVLVREDSLDTKSVFSKAAQTMDAYQCNRMGDAWNMEIYTYTLDRKVIGEDEEIDARIVSEPYLKLLENAGAKNILSLDEPLERGDSKGVAITGTYTYKDAEYEFRLEFFTNGTGIQQIMVSHLKDTDENEERQYGRLISERIFNSIDLAPSITTSPK